MLEKTKTVVNGQCPTTNFLYFTYCLPHPLDHNDQSPDSKQFDVILHCFA